MKGLIRVLYYSFPAFIVAV
jgi:site-specific recombinase XerD